MPTTNPYEIKYGDTLSGLASRLGTDVSALLSINPQITDPNKIQAGATLNLPSMMPAPKSPMGIVSTKTIADKVVVPAQKKLAEMTAPPSGWDATTYANYKKANPNLEPDAQDTAIMKGTAPTPKENPNQAIDGTIGVPVDYAEALKITGGDLSGWHQTKNGQLIPDKTALERQGITGLNESPFSGQQLELQKAQKEAQDAQDVVTAQQKKLEQTVITDEDLSGTVKSITAAWDARIAEMERANKSRISALNTTGIRTGSQYTGGTGLGGVFGGIISEEERQGADRVTELEAQKQQAIAAAKQAQKTHNWQIFAKTMASAESLAEKKLDALKELQKAQAEQDKALREESAAADKAQYERVTKPIADMSLTALEYGAPSDVVAKASQSNSAAEAMVILSPYMQNPKAKYDLESAFLGNLLKQEELKLAPLKRAEVATSIAQKQADIAKTQTETAGVGGGVISPYQAERQFRNIQSVDELGILARKSPGIFGKSAALPLPDFVRSDVYRNFKAQLDTLKANITFGELTAMREASKTGGALGQVSDREGQLLGAALGALNMSQSAENFQKQLTKIKESIQRWQSAFGGGQTTEATITAPDGTQVIITD